MIDENVALLEQLADEIISLDRLAGLATDPADALLINQTALHFRWILDDLITKTGCSGEGSPGWRAWQQASRPPLK